MANINIDNTTFINTCKSCLNVLRDREGLTGEKALRNFAYLLTLKLIEPQFGKNINIDEYEKYDLSDLEDDTVEETKLYLLKHVRFSNLSTLKEDDLTYMLRNLWSYILSQHPSTRCVFLNGKFFDIKYQTTFKCLIEKLKILDLSNTEFDLLGGAYEEIIKTIMVGKTFGQFFTLPIVKNLMVKLINPKVFDDGTIESCADPTMGTGGFLTTYIKYLRKKADKKNIQLDWDFIKNQALYGKEKEPDTYQLAVSNMLISTGYMFDCLEQGDSIREPISRKFDNILANPPFGIKGLNYDDFHYSIKNEYVPIKSSNAVCLFLQAIIYMLKIDGKCAVVFPDGQELHSKTNKVFTCVRQYLLKTCNLKEIVYLPSSSFTNTSIKTCVLYFVKKEEGSDVLSVKTKTLPTTQKETSRIYSFTDKQHNTDVVRFYDYNEEKEKTLLVEVPIENIIEKQYSLNKSDYIERVVELRNDKVEMKTLEEICDIEYGTRIVKKNNVSGEYPVFGSGEATFTSNTYNREGYNIIIGRFALSEKCVRTHNMKLFLNDSGLTVKPKKENVLGKYLGYFLTTIQHIIYNCARGTAQKNLEMDAFKSIKIPIPPIEVQQEIAKYLDFIYEKSIKTSIDKIEELKQLNEYCLNNQTKYGDNEVKTLGEVCDVNSENMKIGQYTEINYIDIASVKRGVMLDLQTLTSDFPSRAKRILKKGDILYSSVRPNLKGYLYIDDAIKNCIASTGFAAIRIKDSNTLYSKYVYYFLTQDTISEYLISKAKGAQYPCVAFDDFKTIELYIPSLERQEQIINYCEYNDNLIKQLEKEIENNKEQAKLFINNIHK